MSDDDLSKLLGQFETCTDVRVAVDRKTGVPRGFLHADFVDVNSAQQAYSLLKDKEILGRRLRVDYTNKSEKQDAFGRRQRMQHIEPQKPEENQS
jgi:RNA recognition motif-containing protein